MSGNDGTETLGCGLDGSVDKGQLRDIVLVDHTEDRLLLAHVNGWPLDVLLVRRLQLTEAIVTDQVLGFLLRLAIDGAKRGGQTTGAQAVDIGFFGSFLLIEKLKKL